MKQERNSIIMGPHILSFKLSDVPNIYFTSDIHANHANIIQYCNRPYKDADEMNKALFDNINNMLSDNPDAVLINCGDFIFGKVSTYDDYIEMIKVNKIYNIIGNHDIKNVCQRRELKPYDPEERVFWSSELIVRILDDKNKPIIIFTVSHVPHCDGQFIGAFNIHGHLHTPKNVETYTGVDANIAKKLIDKGMTYDVGVDGNGYKPVKLTDILTGNLERYNLKVIDFEKWKTLLNVN